MEEKIRQMTLIAAVVAVAALVFIGTIVRATLYAPDAGFDTGFEPPERVSESGITVPRLLSIPSISVETEVERVGVNAKGNMATPSNYRDVGWYKYGPRPGEKGSAVIAGHLDDGLGFDGVFKNLNELRRGDEIIVETKDGHILTFEVVEVISYPYDEVPTERLFNRNDQPRLNLVTCSGKWTRGAKTYDERLVVYTVLKQ